MEAGTVVIVAGGIFLFGLVSNRIDRWPLTMPMVFVGFGALADAMGVVSLELDVEGVSLLAEVTLAVILFGDAIRIDLVALRRQASLPARLLGIGLPLSIALGAVAVWMILDLEFWEAALVAAILAPTDAALGQAVVEDRSVPVRVRQALNVESGLNDGLALPAVLLLIAIVEGEETAAGFWARFMLRQVGLGAVLGVAVGAAGAYGLYRAMRADWVQGIYAQLGTLSLGILALSGALAAGANGFIAAFVAGLAFRSAFRMAGEKQGLGDAEHLDEFTEDVGRGLAMVAFFVFGNVFVNPGRSALTVAVVVCAVVALTIGRLVPVAVSMIGTGAARPTVAFIGWFGPRGLASILFGLLLLEEELDDANELFGVITWTVVASVVLHGATASWGARTYGRWFATHGIDAMPESTMVAEQRVRWGC